jgi:hypothetical protein
MQDTLHATGIACNGVRAVIKPTFKSREDDSEDRERTLEEEMAKQREFIRVEKEKRDAQTKERKKKKGRPRGRDADVNWNDVDDRLVYGELVWDDEKKEAALVHPSMRDLAERWNCAHGLIGRWSTQHDCINRRKEAIRHFGIDGLIELARIKSRIGPKNLRQLTEFLVQAEVGKLVHQGTGQVLDDEKLDEFGMRTKHALPIAEIERLLVHGEPYIDEDEQTIIRYPHHTELARRYGTTTHVIKEIARHGKCQIRRKEANKEARIMLDRQMVELRVRSEVESKKLVLSLIDQYIDKFGDALQTEKVRINDVKDFDRLIRLREFVQGNPDSRREVTGGITLEAIQRRYDNESGTLPPELTGDVIEVEVENVTEKQDLDSATIEGGD